MMTTCPESGKDPGGWHMRLSNSALTGRALPYSAPGNPSPISADLTIYVTRTQLNELVSSVRKSLEGLETTGDREVWQQLRQLLTTPNSSFNIVTPLEYDSDSDQ
ncbi:uncharacterized protein BO80DRAFT_289482 [Aspergillus ibericus CBS 121593]|uniref:Alkyl sulfatase C-terminal domain-containing protein n=1 Tax=Aspergillus ibericus CBS 121593 TaxID=1448316 RepID=A0A395H9S3_9EURO|nr:hypothetical protein BO80DRAFT_289482 [Aspergillus ibericus CBS 121593]RAL03648.1 hypothetical protein BO80DRAFT_289482 [Aspergillus ibericus CBS 121593]